MLNTLKRNSLKIDPLELNCDWLWEGSLKAPRRYMQKFSALMWTHLCNERDFARVAKTKRMDLEISVLVVGKRRAKEFNFKYRKRNYATDVLSFPGAGVCGDLVLCDEVIKKNAHLNRVPFREELAYVFLHGVLHLFGFDHETSLEDEKHMLGLQDRVFDKIMRALGSRSRLTF